jgi:hypothetical protein
MTLPTFSLTDIEQQLSDGFAGVKTQLTGIAGVDATIVSYFLLRTQKRGATIIAGFASGDIDVPEFKALMQDEGYMLAGFLDTLKIVAQVDAQDLFKSVITTIGGIVVKIILPAIP